MNSLSFILYCADVLPSLSDIVGTFGILGFVFGSIAYIAARANYAPYNNTVTITESDIVNICKFWIIAGRRMIILSTIALLFSIAVPGRQTFYLIAASEYGELAIESDATQETMERVLSIINNKLDSYDSQ